MTTMTMAKMSAMSTMTSTWTMEKGMDRTKQQETEPASQPLSRPARSRHLSLSLLRLHPLRAFRLPLPLA